MNRTPVTVAARAALAVLAVYVLAASPAPVSAEPGLQLESPWNEGVNSRVRLVAGTVDTHAHAGRFAGIEIDLDKGWKTYWRNPGDAGMPPRFDWAGSENLASARVLYPLPQRLEDPAGISIGYKDGVVLPVAIEAQDPEKPVLVRLKLNYAVCEELCIPADAELFLAIPAGETGAVPAPAIAQSLARVPRAAGEGPPHARAARIEGEGKERRLVVTVQHGPHANAPDLFVEGPDAWYLGVPKETAREGDSEGEGVTVTYETPLRGKVAAGAKELRLTIATGGDAVEQTVTVEP